MIAGCLRGDERAWNARVDKYSQLIYAVVLRHGVESDEAPDLFQTVWFNVHSDLAKLRKQDSLRPWLTTVVRRRCYHWRLAVGSIGLIRGRCVLEPQRIREGEGLVEPQLQPACVSRRHRSRGWMRNAG